MPKTLAQAYAEQQDEAAEKALAVVTREHNLAEMKRAYKILGGITAIGGLAHNLNAHALRGLEMIETEKLYRHLGYATFVEFLDSDDAPLTKHQYYERMKVLRNEGDTLFNALNESGLPISKRKLLGKGAVALDGETLTVTNEDGGTATIELNEKGRILQTLSALADQTKDLRKKIEKQEKRLEQGQRDYDDLNRRLTEGVPAPPTATITAHDDALMRLMATFTQLLDAAKTLTDAEATKLAPRVFELIASRMNDLRPHYRREMANYTPDETGNIPAVTKALAHITDEDLDELFD